MADEHSRKRRLRRTVAKRVRLSDSDESDTSISLSDSEPPLVVLQCSQPAPECTNTPDSPQCSELSGRLDSSDWSECSSSSEGSDSSDSSEGSI